VPESAAPDVETWWRQLRSAALVGTGRRPAPDPGTLGVRPRTDGTREEQALDGAALAAAIHRAGQLPAVANAAGRTASGPDRMPEAPARALQLLDLVLDQPPAGARHTDLLVTLWLQDCARAGRRLPHGRLPALLDRATRVDRLREPLRGVLDVRGQWLAGQNPAWDWAADPATPATDAGAAPPDAATWSRLPDAERLQVLHQLRRRDPDTARDLLRSTWSSDPARVRAAQLETLAAGLSTADEELLETALDDRSAGVRNTAVVLLDGLPGSARARRMAERLRPLVTVTGLLGRSVEVALPDEPDAAGVRDGLGPAPTGRSQRGWWLETIVAGAPFEVWGQDAERAVRRLQDNEDVLAGLRRAAVRRSDAAWAAALLSAGVEPQLVGVLPPDEREKTVLSVLDRTERAGLGPLLDAVPGPWTAAFSSGVVDDLAGRTFPGGHLDDLALLADRLHPAARPRLEHWLARIPDKAPSEKALARNVRNLLQLQSLRETISEAFDDQ
jgi:hypothetical protein